MSKPVHKQDVDHVQRAKDAWKVTNGEVPEWVLALAEDCNRSTQKKVAEKIGIGASTISQILGNNYGGKTHQIADRLSGVYLAKMVQCPVLGEIPRHRCLDQQGRSFRATSAMRVQLYHACRGGCPHSKFTKAGDEK
jgi:ABC-type uncharacterized transport system ATPase subunit